MKIVFLGLCFLCLSVSRVESKPQVTKLFPIQEETNDPQQRATVETKPLDTLLGKLRATYNFVFRKPENTSNVEKILAKDAPDPDVEVLKLIWSNQMQPNPMAKENSTKSVPERTYLGAKEEYVNNIQPIDRLERLEPLDFEDEMEIVKDRDVEFVTPRNGFHFPVTLSRHFVDWLGSLLGITYGVYSKLARIIYSNNTSIRVN
ncbi:uncharacterized protein LOC143429846 [Xylocopa sonorina]|uniref:uncharacterized protein LOC143429846 n=1 Tax=Xylocopa sonorina TaxID=1818115 RepID=UPI00403AAF22